ncbi:hypothetical protein ACIOD1_29885 [Streptomyces sp. NPDC088097]|uniref:hypothetical protein n=1 Tax=Streptomyces sp. NPDC088097 TaxID=3365823 RepID=UPI00380E32FB
MSCEDESTTARQGAGAGIPAQAMETVEQIVGAVRDGDDERIRCLLVVLAEVADAAVLLYLRERLNAERPR